MCNTNILVIWILYRKTKFQSSLLFLLVLPEDQNPQLMFLELGAFKGSPNSRGILNWIIEILHYYYRKQHKNIKNSQIIEQNLIICLSVFLSVCLSVCLSLPLSLLSLSLSFSALISVYYALRFLRLPSSRVFSVLKRHKWLFVKYIVSFFGLKMVFSTS